MSQVSSGSDRIFTYPFVALCIVAFFGFGNIAVFYNFYSYLGDIGIPSAWKPWLLALEPLAALVLRPVISPWLNCFNGVKIVCASLVLNGIVFLLYPVATGVLSLFALRILHGIAFVCVVSASMALLVALIPPAKSGAMFGIFALNTLIPFAAIPPIVGWLLPLAGGMATIYAWSAILVVPALLLMLPLRRVHWESKGEISSQKHLSFRQIWENLMAPGIGMVFAANFLTFITTTLLFYFMNDFGKEIGLSNPGYFFSASMGGTIVLRVLGNMIFDKLDQRWLLIGSLVVLAGSCCGFAVAQTPVDFLISAGFYGGSLGFAFPLLQSVMFRLSVPAMRGTNENLMLTGMDAAYFAGPFLGGTLLSAGLPFAGLFLVAAGFSLAGMICITFVRSPQRFDSKE